jgi:hypothetical protein
MLQKQVISLPLATGIDTKTDSKLVQGKLLQLVNAELKNGVVVKSTGYVALDSTYSSNSTVSNKAVLSVNGSFALVDNDKISIYDSSSSKFRYIDSFGSCGKSVITVDSNIEDMPKLADGGLAIKGVATGESSKYIVTASFVINRSAINTSYDFVGWSISITVINKSDYSVVRKYTKVNEFAPTAGSFLTNGTLHVCCTDTNFAIYHFGYNVQTVLEEVYDYSLSQPVSSEFVVINRSGTAYAGDVSMGVTNVGSKAYITTIEKPAATSTPTVTVRDFSTRTTTFTGTFPQLTVTPDYNNPASFTVVNKVINVSGVNYVAINCGLTFVLLNPTTNTVFKSFSISTAQTMSVVALGYLSATNEFIILKSYVGMITAPQTRIPVINRYSLTTNSWTVLTDVTRTKQVTVNGVTTNELSNYFGYDANKQYGVHEAVGALMCSDSKAYYLQKYLAHPIIKTTDVVYPLNVPVDTVARNYYPSLSEIKCSVLLMDSDYNVCDRVVEYNGAIDASDRQFCSAVTSSQFNSVNSGDIGLSSINLAYPVVTRIVADYVNLSDSQYYGCPQMAYDVVCSRLTLSNNYPIRSNRINNCAVITSPSFFEVNNNQLTENNFYDFPQILVGNATGTGTFTGTYSYKAIYEYTDASGNLVRSSESIAKGITLSNQKPIVSVSIPPWFSKKKLQRVKIFRTLNKGNSYYLADTFTQLTQPVTNTAGFYSPFAKNIGNVPQISSWVNNVPDDLIKNKELIYTAGGVLPAFPLPSSITSIVHNNRIFCVPHANKNLVRYTKVLQPTIATESFIGLDLIFESRGGDIVELASLDEKLIVFKKTSIYGVQGDGADAVGNNTTFSLPYLINSPVGCTDPLSVVRIPDGIMFKSSKGIYLLNRSLSVEYIGADVEKYNGEKVISANLIDAENKVKFTTSAGNILTYDFYYRVWYVESGLSFVSTSLLNGRLVGVFNTGKVWSNDPSTYLRDGAQYQMTIQTGWLKMSGLQSYARAYRLMLLGDYKDAHTVNFDVSYDYVEASAHSSSFTPVNVAGQPVQVRVNFERQKCESVRLTFTDTSTGASGNSFTMTDLSILAGVKSGFNKVLPSKTVSV